MWSAFHGKHKHLVEAQKRMAALPGAEGLLRGLTAFEPSKRTSMQQALSSELFTPFASPLAAGAADEEPAARTLRYLVYLEKGAEEAVGGGQAAAAAAAPAAASTGRRRGGR